MNPRWGTRNWRVGNTQDDMYQRDAREPFLRMVFNTRLDNTDDQEKNHALLVVHRSDNGRLKLAPAHDVLLTNSGHGYQEFICATQGRDSTLENAMSQCEAFGPPPAEVAAEVATVIAAVGTWQEHFAGAGVTERDIDSVPAPSGAGAPGFVQEWPPDTCRASPSQ